MNYTPTAQDTHTCPGGCGGAVVRNMFACASCWRRLPQDYRTPILTSRWANDHAAHSHAMVDAMTWYRVDADTRAADRIRRDG